MLQQELPDDYVIATGETLAIKGISRSSFHVNLDWHDYVRI
jgi:GDP-D-mannose dehydratase